MHNVVLFPKASSELDDLRRNVREAILLLDVFLYQTGRMIEACPPNATKDELEKKLLSLRSQIGILRGLAKILFAGSAKSSRI